MNYTTLWPAFVFSFISLVGYGQTKKFMYYFDKDLNSVDKKKAVFNGIGINVNGVLELKTYNALNNILLSKEHFTDSSLGNNIGLYQSFNSNSTIALEGNYVEGKEDGLWTRRDTLGRIIDSIIYSKGEKILEANTNYYINGYVSRYEINNIKTDQLQKTFFNNKGMISSEINFTGETGIEKRYDTSGLVRTDTVFTRSEIEASFPGGERLWMIYINTQVSENIDAITKDGVSGICRVKFTIDKNGNVVKPEALTLKGTKLAETIIKALHNAPKWLPAIQYGRPVNAFREQPITFTVQD